MPASASTPAATVASASIAPSGSSTAGRPATPRKFFGKLFSKKKDAPLVLVHITGAVAGKENEAKAFADAVLEAAYRGASRAELGVRS